MQKWDPDNPTDPIAWRRALAAWKARQANAAAAQKQARAELDAAQAVVATLTAWVDQLSAGASAAASQATTGAAVTTTLRRLQAGLDETEGLISDHTSAREVATSRLLAGPAVTAPVVLLPLRLQTKWMKGDLCVRIYPCDLSVDRHEPRLSEAEAVLGQTYWRTRALPGDQQREQAWQDLASRTDPHRAAWIAHATDPASLPASGLPDDRKRDNSWDVAVRARLLPDRFAVVALAGSVPINLAPVGKPAQYVAWGAAVPDPLPLGFLHNPDEATWVTHFKEAVECGMAVRIPVPSGTSIDELVVVGLRTGGSEHLEDLLEAQAWSAGVEVLADGTPTNNKGDGRSARTHDREQASAMLLLDEDRPQRCGPASGGAQLAALLGIDDSALAPLLGADLDRASAADAMRLLVGLTVTGSLAEQLGPDWPRTWDLIRPGGPTPTLRVGHQPYAVIPATAPVRWQAAGTLDQPFSAAVRRWVHAHTPVIDQDPALPAPSAMGGARRVTRTDDSALTSLLLEGASSSTWTGDSGRFESLDGLVGPQGGPGDPNTYLPALVGAGDSELQALATTLESSLLGRIALAARSGSTGDTRARVIGALRALASVAASTEGRSDLARLLGEHLDAASHRLDAWVTAAATQRCLAQRGSASASVVGAYGYLTDVKPGSEPRSQGHIHAPSLTHAATAAVLRSGYLAQRRAAWRDKLAAAQASGNASAIAAAQAGLDELQPLDPNAEAHLPLAVDLSSRRVRQARRLLDAVRQGQPLAAVLGYQVERDLARSGLQQYLPALRKLTRFHTGSELEALEDARRTAQDGLAAAEARLVQLQNQAAALQQPIDTASALLDGAKARQALADQKYQPYRERQKELDDLKTTIAADKAALATIDAKKPAPVTRQRTIPVPG